MTTTLPDKPMFKIGQRVYWIESGSNLPKEVPCRMCFGKRKVTIILGDNSEQESECGACEKGIYGPSGTMKIWEPHASIRSGLVTGVSAREGITYEVGYRSLKSHELFDSDLGLEALRQERCEEEKERAEKHYRDHFMHLKKNQIWRAGYHRREIKSHEDSIKWHRMRLCMIKEKDDR